MPDIPERLVEVSPATKDIFDTIVAGFSSLGILQSEIDTDSLTPEAVQYHRQNYGRAIENLGEFILQEEFDIVYTPSTEIATYSIRKSPSGFLHKQRSSRYLQAGEPALYRTESQIKQLSRSDDHGTLPRTEDYLAFYTDKHRYLRVSADQVALDLYTGDATLELAPTRT